MAALPLVYMPTQPVCHQSCPCAPQPLTHPLPYVAAALPLCSPVLCLSAHAHLLPDAAVVRAKEGVCGTLLP